MIFEPMNLYYYTLENVLKKKNSDSCRPMCSISAKEKKQPSWLFEYGYLSLRGALGCNMKSVDTSFSPDK